MTKFEEELIDNGYLTHTFNWKTMKYERWRNIISTMVNLDHRYIHKDNKLMLDKINSGISVMGDDFTFKDREGEICFGLNEFGKPPTLISPRPRIEIKRIIEGNIVFENEQIDDSMNIVLREKSFKEIFKAMYDDRIVIKIDLTGN